MAANIKRGADGRNPRKSDIKEKPVARSDSARIDFLMGVVRMLHENALGRAETESVFDNDATRSLTELKPVKVARSPKEIVAAETVAELTPGAG